MSSDHHQALAAANAALNRLSEMLPRIEAAIGAGKVVYLHDIEGGARVLGVAACLLGRLYGLSARESARRVELSACARAEPLSPAHPLTAGMGTTRCDDDDGEKNKGDGNDGGHGVEAVVGRRTRSDKASNGSGGDVEQESQWAGNMVEQVLKAYSYS